MPITNPTMAHYSFLKGMFSDPYFPTFLVEKGKQILVGLCEQIETQQPGTDAAVLVLTHAATEGFNQLAEEFGDSGSEIETAAREAIAEDFNAILQAYEFSIDVEEAIAPRDW